MTDYIEYNDSDILKLVFSTLVIKVSSIVKKFDSVKEFADRYNFYAETNGTLLIKSEMCSPPFRLEAFSVDVLVANGLKPKEDFVFLEEMLTRSVNWGFSEYINKPHPHCKDIDWLQSIIILDKGNFIWYCNADLSDFEKDANFKLYKNLFHHENEKINMSPRIFKIDDTHVHYTVSDSQRYYKIHRDALWYNKEKYG